MPDLEDSDPPSFIEVVNRQVTLDMLTTDELVQELMARERLLVITARRRVPRSTFEKADFLPAIRAILSCDLAKRILNNDLMGEDVITLQNDLEFSAMMIVLKEDPQEEPI